MTKRKLAIDIKHELIGNATARVVLHIGDLASQKKLCIVSNFWRDLDITYCHAMKICKELEHLALIDSYKHGRVRQIKLTENGEFLYAYLESVRMLFEKISKPRVNDI